MACGIKKGQPIATVHKSRKSVLCDMAFIRMIGALESRQMPSKKNQKRILVIAYKYFDHDPRPQREIAALVEHGYQVDVICLRRPRQNMKALENEQLRLYALPITRKRGNRIQYLLEYFSFFCYASIISAWLCFRNSYRLIQIFVMPEALILCSVWQKLFGTKILMDWEDPSREVYLTKFHGKLDFLFLPIIGLMEKISVRAADTIITPNEGFRKAFVARGHDRRKIKIVMNAPDKRIFSRPINRKHVASNNEFNIFFYGGILQRHGLDIAIKALRVIVDQIPHVRLAIVGCGEEEFIEDCLSLADKLDVHEQIDWYGRVTIQEIPRVMRRASVVVIPNRENCFTKINLPQRIMECGYLRVPMVVSRLPGIEHYVDETSVCFFEPGNHQDLAEKIVDLYNFPEKLNTFAENAYKVCQRLEWEESYLKVVDYLITSRSW